MTGTQTKFIFKCTEAAKKFLLDEGIDFKYGARHLKRAIERFLVYPLSNLIATDQVGFGDLVIVDYAADVGKLVFSKEHGGALIADDEGDTQVNDHHDWSSGNHAMAVGALETRTALAPAPAREK